MNIINKITIGPVGLICCLLIMTGCSTFSARNQNVSDVPKPVPEEGYKPNDQYGNVALDENQRVQNWVNYFTGRGRKYMHLYLERSARYIPMMKATFRERGMPDELAYVAMIESGFSATAFSHASAVGYWQFIRGTGKRYNLRIDEYVDERRDPILSTHAAATYLDSLYSIFGNWHLSLAAYNAGEGRVLRAVMKKRTRDFWELTAKRKVLARETMEYVPKYIAAVRIASDPAKYGFTDIDFEPAFTFDTVVIDKSVSLEKLSEEIGISYEDMKRMNPRYKSDFVPVYADRVNAVRVPVGKREEAIAALEKAYSDKPLRYIASFEWYKVRNGDTLSHIARKHGTSIARLTDLNDLTRRTRLRVGQKLKIPDGYGKASVIPKEKRVAASTSSNRLPSGKMPEKVDVSSIVNTVAMADAGSVTMHIVQKGDTLSSIAAKYGVSISEIKKLNNLNSRAVIRAGAKLKVSRAAATESSRNSSSSLRKVQNTSSAKINKAEDKKIVHVVGQGENLSSIAKKYDVNISKIAKVNRLKNKSILSVGSRLTIPD